MDKRWIIRPPPIPRLPPTFSGMNKFPSWKPIVVEVYLLNHTMMNIIIPGKRELFVENVMRIMSFAVEPGMERHYFLRAFALWYKSPLLDLQLNPTNEMYWVGGKWKRFLQQLTLASKIDVEDDLPMVMLSRNIYFPIDEELEIRSPQLIELLYEEAKFNVIEGLYVCEPWVLARLGALQAAIEYGRYSHKNPDTLRDKLGIECTFIPFYLRQPQINSDYYLIKLYLETQIPRLYKKGEIGNSKIHLIRIYLAVCRGLPFYGCAFFDGSVERVTTGLWSYLFKSDKQILFAINERGVFLIDSPYEMILGLPFGKFSWDFMGNNLKSKDPLNMPSILLQFPFPLLENGIRVFKIIQVFSKEAYVIRKVLKYFWKLSRKPKKPRPPYDYFNKNYIPGFPTPYDKIPDNGPEDNQVHVTSTIYKLSTATFDMKGNLIGKAGSLKFLPGYHRRDWKF